MGNSFLENCLDNVLAETFGSVVRRKEKEAKKHNPDELARK